MKFYAEKEIEEIPKILEKRRKVSLKRFSLILKEPILLIGMQSSVNLSCYEAERIGDKFGLNIKVRYASEVSKIKNINTLIALSNSGETRETVKIFKNIRSKIKIAINRNKNSSLAKYSTHFIQMICSEEKAIAATKSVVEQAYILQQLLFEKEKKYVLITNREIKEIKRNIKLDFDKKIINKFVKAGRIIVIGQRSLSNEVQNKIEEITRTPAEYEIGTQILHGPIASLAPNDIILVVDQDMIVGYNSLLRKKVRCSIISLNNLKIKGSGQYKEIIKFSGLLNFICHIGKAKGVDLDNPESLSKIAINF